jgi:hypothetical protein
MNQSNQFSLKGVADLSLCLSIGLLLLHFYYFGYPLFDHFGMTSKPTDRILFHIVNTHLFDTLIRSQVIIILFLGISVLAIQGRKSPRGTLREAIKVACAGMALFYFCGVVFEVMGATPGTAIFYIISATAGWMMMLTGGIKVKRVLVRPASAQDPFDHRQKGFPVFTSSARAIYPGGEDQGELDQPGEPAAGYPDHGVAGIGEDKVYHRAADVPVDGAGEGHICL